MKNRLIAFLVTLCGIMMCAAPAGAVVEHTNADCNKHTRGPFRSAGYVCVEVTWWRQADGSGITLDRVLLQVSPRGAFAGYPGPVVDGHGLYLFPGKGGPYLWHHTDRGSNIGYQGVHVYDMPNGALRAGNCSLVIYYPYKARLLQWPDPTDEIQFKFGYC